MIENQASEQNMVFNELIFCSFLKPILFFPIFGANQFRFFIPGNRLDRQVAKPLSARTVIFRIFRDRFQVLQQPKMVCPWAELQNLAFVFGGSSFLGLISSNAIAMIFNLDHIGRGN